MGDDRSITFVTSSMRLSGGVLVLVHLANGLAARGYRVTIVTSLGGAEREVQQRLLPQVQVLAANLSIEEAASFAGKVRLSWQLMQLVPKCDTIIATHTPTAVPALLARYLMRRGRRAMWFHQHHPSAFEGQPIEGWLSRHAPGWFERVITVSDVIRESMEHTSGVRAWVVPQGFSPSGVDELPERARPPCESKVVLYVGDQRERKGWDDFLAAMTLVQARHPDLRLAIVTKDEGSLDVPLPHQIYVRPSWGEFVALCDTCRVFVAASWWEGFGRPPLEAMACGVPVVTTDSGGVREYARHEVNCLLTPIRDPEALAEAIDRVLVDELLAQRLSKEGRQTAREFTWKRALDSFVHALEAQK